MLLRWVILDKSAHLNNFPQIAALRAIIVYTSRSFQKQNIPVLNGKLAVHVQNMAWLKDNYCSIEGGWSLNTAYSPGLLEMRSTDPDHIIVTVTLIILYHGVTLRKKYTICDPFNF